jgi:hypothetical protein
MFDSDTLQEYLNNFKKEEKIRILNESIVVPLEYDITNERKEPNNLKNVILIF